MPNNRPDQVKFDLFSAHFIQLDSDLETFCAKNNFKLEKHLNRQPCRVLRKGDNPTFIIEVNLVENWFSAEYDINMSHAMGVCAYYVAPDDKEHIWKLAAFLAENVTFETIKHDLGSNLLAALRKVASWTPSIIMDNGIRLENLQTQYPTGSNK